MLKKSASGVLASLRDSTYRSVRLASSLAAALLDGHFEHPGVSTPSKPFAKISVVIHVCTEYSCNLLDFLRHGVLFDCPRPGRQHLGTIIDRTLNLFISRLLKHLIFPQNRTAIVVKHANSEVE